MILNGVPRSGAVERFDVKCGMMCVCVLWCDVNVAISDMV